MVPKISVIVSTLNQCASLRETISSITQSTFDRQDYEVIVVDNGSSDDTARTVRELIAESSASIRYFFEPEPGLLAARHCGAIEARGSILTFTDDDVAFDRDTLRSIDAAFSDPGISLVGGRNLPIYGIEPPDWLQALWEETPQGRYCFYFSLLDFGDQAVEIDPGLVWGLSYSIRKQALFDLGGFNPDLFPDRLAIFQGDGESGLSNKAQLAGYRAMYVPGAVVRHRIPAHRLTIPYLEKRSYTEGIFCSYRDLRQDLLGTDAGKPMKLLAALRSKGRWRQLLKASILALYWQVRLELLRRGDADPRRLVKAHTKLAYNRGYRFHRARALRSPAIMEWVGRQNYWSYTLPKL